MCIAYLQLTFYEAELSTEFSFTVKGMPQGAKKEGIGSFQQNIALWHSYSSPQGYKRANSGPL